jgi:hypothetical protein
VSDPQRFELSEGWKIDLLRLAIVAVFLAAVVVLMTATSIGLAWLIDWFIPALRGET